MDMWWQNRERDVSLSVKHPAILPRQHHFTQLVIIDAHERVFHNGIKETLTEVRSQFWIVKGRQLVRRLLYHCAICKRYEGKPFSAPLPPQLPEFRVTEKPPFTVDGVDFAGPLYFKTQRERVTSQKVCVCLFQAMHVTGFLHVLVCTCIYKNRSCIYLYVTLHVRVDTSTFYFSKYCIFIKAVYLIKTSFSSLSLFNLDLR